MDECELLGHWVPSPHPTAAQRCDNAHGEKTPGATVHPGFGWNHPPSVLVLCRVKTDWGHYIPGKNQHSILQINQSKHGLYAVKQHQCQDLCLPALQNSEDAACGNSNSLTQIPSEMWGEVSWENKDCLHSLGNDVWPPRPHPNCTETWPLSGFCHRIGGKGWWIWWQNTRFGTGLDPASLNGSKIVTVWWLNNPAWKELGVLFAPAASAASEWLSWGQESNRKTKE